MKTRRLRAGDWVEVRSAEEVLATLDPEGCLDALPFMPEMLQYCGKRFRIFKSAHKSCNTLGGGGIRRMPDAVHLEGLRCDGEAHGGCQASCLLYWKTAWLKPCETPTSEEPRGKTAPDAHPAFGGAPPSCTLEMLARATRVPLTEVPDPGERYRCQATEHGRATSTARWWDPRLYVLDLITRNVRPWDLMRYGLLAALNIVLRLVRLGTYPEIRGAAGAKTPTATMDLRPGEWVQVRSKDEIMPTLNGASRNQGLLFDVEMLPYCGQTVRVLRRVERLIDERTGRMIAPKKPCLILDSVTCGGGLSRERLFCPRSIYPYWHEVWLKRAQEGPVGATHVDDAKR
jgi:hypothetical protein